MQEATNDHEVERRTLAVERALILLIGDLATRGMVSADEAEVALQVIGGSSQASSARTSSALMLMRQLRRLRANDGAIAPGATERSSHDS